MKKLSVVLIVLAVAIVGYAAVKIGSGGELSDWNSYTHEGSAEFSFNYPSEKTPAVR